MARGVRKSALEKKQMELNEVRESIRSYENALDTLREKEKDLVEEIELEEVKKLNETLKENHMSVDDILELMKQNVSQNIA